MCSLNFLRYLYSAFGAKGIKKVSRFVPSGAKEFILLSEGN